MMSTAIFTNSVTFTHRSGSEQQASKENKSMIKPLSHFSWLLFKLIIMYSLCILLFYIYVSLYLCIHAKVTHHTSVIVHGAGVSCDR